LLRAQTFTIVSVFKLRIVCTITSVWCRRIILHVSKLVSLDKPDCTNGCYTN